MLISVHAHDLFGQSRGEIEMIHKYTCQNGVRVVLEKMPYVRSVAIGIYVKAGSVNETEAEWGLSHFIEHMLFKGTSTRSAKMIAEQFDRMGGDLNAYTAKEMTCFYTTVLDYHAEQAIDILSDMLFHSNYDEVEIEKEKSVILEEIASIEDTPDDDVDERLWTQMYADHPIGKSIGGTAETIGSFDRNSIKNFMERHYTPDKIVISIAGNYDDRLLKRIESLFGSTDAHQKQNNSNEAVRIPNFHSGITSKRKEIEQAHISIGYPGLSIKDEKLHDLILLDSIVGGTMSSRLFQEIREDKGLAYTVFSYYSSYTSIGSFVIYAGTNPENVDKMMESIDRIVMDTQRDGVTEEELSNAKEQLKGSFILGLESSEAIMHRNGRNELILGEHKSVREVVELIDRVNLADVGKMAYEMFRKDRAVSIIAP